MEKYALKADVKIEVGLFLRTLFAIVATCNFPSL